jgi:hypothetical protein
VPGTGLLGFERFAASVAALYHFRREAGALSPVALPLGESTSPPVIMADVQHEEPVPELKEDIGGEVRTLPGIGRSREL